MVRLTEKVTGEAVYVNPDRVHHVSRDDSGSVLDFGNTYVWVRETSEDVTIKFRQYWKQSPQLPPEFVSALERLSPTHD
jgi:hypothetical protein